MPSDNFIFDPLRNTSVWSEDPDGRRCQRVCITENYSSSAPGSVVLRAYDESGNAQRVLCTPSQRHGGFYALHCELDELEVILSGSSFVIGDIKVGSTDNTSGSTQRFLLVDDAGCSQVYDRFLESSSAYQGVESSDTGSLIFGYYTASLPEQATEGQVIRLRATNIGELYGYDTYVSSSVAHTRDAILAFSGANKFEMEEFSSSFKYEIQAFSGATVHELQELSSSIGEISATVSASVSEKVVQMGGDDGANAVSRIRTDTEGRLQVVVVAGSTPVLESWTTTAAESVGEIVYNNGGVARQANAGATGTMPVIGIIISKSDATNCVVVTHGKAAGVLAGMTPGAYYYADTTNGLLTTTVPSLGGGFAVLQPVGYAESATDFIVDRNPHIVL